MPPLFTIILPTVHDRGLLLPMVVGTIQHQTIQALELFIIGDGVTESTRQVAQKLTEQDPRVRFFDYPKHSRRGETYRHELLTQEANGQYVAYILDRDLWLPNHLETLRECFKVGNFVSTNYYKPLYDRNVMYGFPREDHRKILSATAHTLALYKALPYGWRTTPPQHYTDAYMWDQFAEHKDFKMQTTLEATVLYFKRGAEYPGIPTEKRVAELQFWRKKLQENDIVSQLKKAALRQLLEERKATVKQLILVKGKTLAQWWGVAQTKKVLYINKIKRFLVTFATRNRP